MMYQKAMLFGDERMAERILEAAKPGKQKKLGRQVRGFDQEIWFQNAKLIVYRGNYAKFTQNENLKKRLFKTKGTTLVEASPTDIIWGIGLSEQDPRCQDRKQWQGTNWLGEVLTQLREDLLAFPSN